VARRKRDNFVADGVKTFEFRGEVNGAGSLGGPPLVEAGNSNGITSCDGAIVLCVIEDEREHSVEKLGGIDSMIGVL